MNRITKVLIIALTVFVLILICSVSTYAIDYKKYQAVVLGEVVKKEIKNKNGFYFTEYKLKTKKWLFKNPQISGSKYIILKVAGAELTKKGLVIKTSATPSLIPMHKDFVFFLENPKKKEKNVFTVTIGGIIRGTNLLNTAKG